MAAQRLFLPRVQRKNKNKKSVSSFYVFYGTLHPKVECQFEFFPININYEAVSSRKSSVGLMHKYQGSIAGYRLGKKKEKLLKEEEKPMAKCYQYDYLLWGKPGTHIHTINTHTYPIFSISLSIEAA
jgi:hypothetical protein